MCPRILIFFAAIPVILAPTRYPRRIYLLMIGLLTAAGIWAAGILTPDFTEYAKP